jgi:hypothetical protein
MTPRSALLLALALQTFAAAASAQSADLDNVIMDDLTPAQQQRVRAGEQLMLTNPMLPTPNQWTVTYYQLIPNADTQDGAFDSAAIYVDYEHQPDYQFPLLLDFEILAGAGTAAVKGRVTTPTADGGAEQSLQTNAVFRQLEDTNVLYSATSQTLEAPQPEDGLLAQFTVVDFQNDPVSGFPVMRYRSTAIPRAQLAGNSEAKRNLIDLGRIVVANHVDRMTDGASPEQQQALHQMLQDTGPAPSGTAR